MTSLVYPSVYPRVGRIGESKCWRWMRTIFRFRPRHHSFFSDDPKTAHKFLYIKDLAQKGGAGSVGESQDVLFLRVPLVSPWIGFQHSVFLGFKDRGEVSRTWPLRVRSKKTRFGEFGARTRKQKLLSRLPATMGGRLHA